MQNVFRMSSEFSRNGFVKSIGTLVDIIDSADAEGMRSPRQSVDAETTTELTQCDRGTLTMSDEPEPSQRCPSTDLKEHSSKPPDIYDSSTPSSYTCSSPLSSVAAIGSSPHFRRRSQSRLARRAGIVGSGPVSPTLSAFSTVE